MRLVHIAFSGGEEHLSQMPHPIDLVGSYIVNIRPIKLDLQFLAQNSEKMMPRAGGYYSLFIIAENR